MGQPQKSGAAMLSFVAVVTTNACVLCMPAASGQTNVLVRLFAHFRHEFLPLLGPSVLSALLLANVAGYLLARQRRLLGIFLALLGASSIAAHCYTGHLVWTSAAVQGSSHFSAGGEAWLLPRRLYAEAAAPAGSVSVLAPGQKSGELKQVDAKLGAAGWVSEWLFVEVLTLAWLALEGDVFGPDCLVVFFGGGAGLGYAMYRVSGIDETAADAAAQRTLLPGLVYMAIGVASCVHWLPHIMSWADDVGSEEGRLGAGMTNEAGVYCTLQVVAALAVCLPIAARYTIEQASAGYGEQIALLRFLKVQVLLTLLTLAMFAHFAFAAAIVMSLMHLCSALPPTQKKEKVKLT